MPATVLVLRIQIGVYRADLEAVKMGGLQLVELDYILSIATNGDATAARYATRRRPVWPEIAGDARASTNT